MGFIRALAVTICVTAWAVVAFFLIVELTSATSFPSQIEGIWIMVLLLAILGMCAYGCTKIGRQPSHPSDRPVYRPRDRQRQVARLGPRRHCDRHHHGERPPVRQRKSVAEVDAQLPEVPHLPDSNLRHRSIVPVLLTSATIVIVLIGGFLLFPLMAPHHSDEIAVLASLSTSTGNSLVSQGLTEAPSPVLYFFSADNLRLTRTVQMPSGYNSLSLLHFYGAASQYTPFAMVDLQRGRIVWPIANYPGNTSVSSEAMGLASNSGGRFLGDNAYYINTRYGVTLYFDLFQIAQSNTSIDHISRDIVLQQLDSNSYNAIGIPRHIELLPPGERAADPRILGVYAYIDLPDTYVIAWNDGVNRTRLTEVDENGTVIKRANVPAAGTMDMGGWNLYGLSKRIDGQWAYLWSFDVRSWSLAQGTQFLWQQGTTIISVSHTPDGAYQFAVEAGVSGGTTVHIIGTSPWKEHATARLPESTSEFTPFCFYRDHLYFTVQDGQRIRLVMVGIDGRTVRSLPFQSQTSPGLSVDPLAIAPIPQEWRSMVWGTACISQPVTQKK